ncbi:MAG: M15 family metallopeptidase [Bacteroidales bacterium]|nr:M15 family metallopeptidase [Bacteroidales bacterium]
MMKNLLNAGLLSASMLLCACSQAPQPSQDEAVGTQEPAVLVADTLEAVNADTPVEARLRAMGLVDIAEMDSSIAVHLVYATPYNFLGKQLYHGLNKAFMLPEMAEKVLNAQRALKKIRPDLNLLIYDASRPVSVQYEMWNMVKGTSMTRYISNPNKGHGMHSYGAAVDVTLMDCACHPLPMGSEYDYFGEEAHITNEQQLLQDGRITKRELENRLLLRKVMTEAGLHTIQSEWWHFNLTTSETERQKLQLIDF